MAGVLVFLQTDAGGAFVRGRVLAAANDSLSGSLELGEVDFQGSRLVLHDVTLRDPEGEVVADGPVEPVVERYEHYMQLLADGNLLSAQDYRDQALAERVPLELVNTA